MTTEFRICEGCGLLRAAHDFRGERCRYAPCSLPRMAAPAMPVGVPVVRHRDIKPPADALEAQVRRMRETR